MWGEREHLRERKELEKKKVWAVGGSLIGKATKEQCEGVDVCV